MKYFRLWPAFNSREEIETKWVNDQDFFMEFDAYQSRPLLPVWPRDLSFQLEGRGIVADVMSSLHAFYFSRQARDKIDSLLSNSVEWLPVKLGLKSDYFVLHPLQTIELGPQAVFRQNRPQDNIIEVSRYDFDADEQLPACFLVHQAPGSPARESHGTLGIIIVNETLRWKMGVYRGVDFAQVYERK
ncbi:MAG TPA: hypothetical protein PLX97_02695 [Gemmatales bacterium]|nr:hypothetical protein [Gemmatales bacterium]